MDQLKRINIALSDIIEETFDIAHLKDARTGKYIQSSPGFAEKLGLESARDVIGLTVNDLITHPKTWGGKNFSPGFVQWRGQQPEIFKNFDQKVQRSKRRFLTTIIKQSSPSIPTVAILLFNAACLNCSVCIRNFIRKSRRFSIY